MPTELEQKLDNFGETSFKLIRASASPSFGGFAGNILMTVKHYNDGDSEMVSIRIRSLINSGKLNNLDEKLSINKVEAVVDHKEKTVKIGPIQGIQIENNLQNKGLGCFMLCELAQWLKKSATGCSIAPYEVSLSESVSVLEKEKLLAIAAKFNLDASLNGLSQQDLIIKFPPVSQINEYYNSDKIQELELEEFIVNLVSERLKKEQEIDNMKQEIEKLGEESFGGIPKKQLIKYTLICCGATLAIIFLLISK